MPFRFGFRAAYAILVAAALVVAAHRPLLFQKLNVVAPAAAFPPVERSAAGAVDVAPTIAAIPLRHVETWAVEPAARYRRTIVEGGGNCSQLSFGLAYELGRSRVDYQVVHLMKVDGLASGNGHTVLRFHYRLDGAEQLGVVDLVYGGVPRTGGRALDVADLDAGPVEDFSFRMLNAAGRHPGRVYREDLAESVAGYVSAGEVSRYYGFLEAVFVPLGHEKLEKYVYDGLALVLGFLPPVHVPRYEELMAPYRLEAALHRTALWTLRSTLVVAPLLVGLAARRKLRERARH